MKRFFWIVIALCLSATIAAAAGDKKVTKDSELLLVLWTANDCTYCARWKGSLGGKGDLQNWSGYKKITYREVERPFISSGLAAEHFPADLKWLFDRRAESGKLRTGVIPAWTIYVDKEEAGQANGTKNWDKVIFPLLKELVAEKIALQEKSMANPAVQGTPASGRP